MREEVTVRMSPSLAVTIVAGIVTVTGAFYAQAQGLREETERKYTTRMEHENDIERVREMADTRFKYIRESLDRIENKIDKETPR